MAWSRPTPPAFAGGVPSAASFILADEVCSFNEKKNRVVRPDPRRLPHDGAFSALVRPFRLQNRPSRPVLIRCFIRAVGLSSFGKRRADDPARLARGRAMAAEIERDLISARSRKAVGLSLERSKGPG
ncbi:MAG: hypothetical protein OXI01_23075 [Albidovulum sp.]|nr:hypothetical protein [Albidovulum sp.]